MSDRDELIRKIAEQNKPKIEPTGPIVDIPVLRAQPHLSRDERKAKRRARQLRRQQKLSRRRNRG